jgi:hypothetical protein
MPDDDFARKVWSPFAFSNPVPGAAAENLQLSGLAGYRRLYTKPCLSHNGPAFASSYSSFCRLILILKDGLIGLELDWSGIGI